MANLGTLEVTTQGERALVMTRNFNAPRSLVFDAFTKPELISRWLGAIEGWTMPVCEVDLRVGGRYRYLWHGPDGAQMGMGGEFLEITPPERLVSTEKFDESWYPGGAIVTTSFEELEGRTTMTMEVLYDSKEALEVVLESPATEGVSMGFAKLDEVLATLA